MGRRLFKKVYTNDVLTQHTIFAYDDYKLIAEFDALNNNNQTASYLWQLVGLDVNDFDEWASLHITGNVAMEYKVGTVSQTDNNICSLRVPNMVVAYRAGNLNALGRFHVNWDDNINKMKEKEFYVVDTFVEGCAEKYAYTNALQSSASAKHYMGHIFWVDMDITHITHLV